ncbi:MAG: hypothetical protein JWP87_4765 [Labilithrix sp.]|nr:hypothetical protein [Labilithrix sp.]
MKIGRNDPCHCGSGQKYKKCHLAKDDAAKSAELAAAAAAAEAAAKAKADAEAEAAEKEEKEGGGGPSAAADRPAAARSKDAAGTRPRTPAPTQAPAFRRKSV